MSWMFGSFKVVLVSEFWLSVLDFYFIFGVEFSFSKTWIVTVTCLGQINSIGTENIHCGWISINEEDSDNDPDGDADEEDNEEGERWGRGRGGKRERQGRWWWWYL